MVRDSNVAMMPQELKSLQETPQEEAHQIEGTIGGPPLTKSPPESLAFPTGFMMSSAFTTAACGQRTVRST